MAPNNAAAGLSQEQRNLAKTAVVTLGDTVNLGTVGYVGPSPDTTTSGSVIDYNNASRATLGAVYDLNHSSRANPWSAVLDAGKETFGNPVFQQPLTTLAKAGVAEIALIATVYTGGALPMLGRTGVAIYNAAVYSQVSVRTAVFIAGVATGASSTDPTVGLKSQQLFSTMMCYHSTG